ncbi:hypothetical protein CAPTEDRAFT_215624, partial [Capitella teleta]
MVGCVHAVPTDSEDNNPVDPDEESSSSPLNKPNFAFGSPSEGQQTSTQGSTQGSSPARAAASDSVASESLACPLCAERVGDMGKVEQHLVQVHSVATEVLKKLLLLAKPAAASSPAAAAASPVEDMEENDEAIADDVETMESRALKLAEEASADGVDLSEQENDEHFRCQTCSKTFQNIDALYSHQNELGHLELKQTPRGPGYLCWKKGCNQYFKTAQALQVHFREIHAQPTVAVSERHVYKFRCHQCSLAFKTLEKLQLHSYYHIIRAATECALCKKSFRTASAMHQHVESVHFETMSDVEKEEFQASLAASKQLSLSLEKDTEEPEEAAMEDDEDSSSSYKEEQFMEDYINSQAMAETATMIRPQ